MDLKLLSENQAIVIIITFCADLEKCFRNVVKVACSSSFVRSYLGTYVAFESLHQRPSR